MILLLVFEGKLRNHVLNEGDVLFSALRLGYCCCLCSKSSSYDVLGLEVTEYYGYDNLVLVVRCKSCNGVYRWRVRLDGLG